MSLVRTFTRSQWKSLGWARFRVWGAIYIYIFIYLFIYLFIYIHTCYVGGCLII